MTSWIRATGRKPPALEKSYLFETSDASFPAQSLGLLYAIMFAKSESTPLHVGDQVNYVRSNFPLFRSAFKDAAGVRYTDGKVLGAVGLAGSQRFAQHVQGLNLAQVRPVAKEALVLHEAALEEIRGVLDHTRVTVQTRQGSQGVTSFLDAAPDLMLAVGARQLGGPAVSSYVSALRAAVTEEGLDAARILVYSEAPAEFVQEIIKSADPRWTFLVLPAIPSGGPKATARRQAYFTELAYLAILQSSLALVCERGSALGQFLLATAAAPDEGTLHLV